MLVDVYTTVSANDEDPVAPATFKAVHVVLVRKHCRIRLKFFYLLCPAYESILFELFQREIDGLVQGLFAE